MARAVEEVEDEVDANVEPERYLRGGVVWYRGGLCQIPEGAAVGVFFTGRPRAQENSRREPNTTPSRWMWLIMVVIVGHG